MAELQAQMRQSSDSLEATHLRDQLAMERAKLEQLTWMEEQRARDVREVREQILRGNAQHMERIAEVENLKSAMTDLIKESRNQDVSLSGTAWTQNPPNGLKEFIDQVDISEAEGLAALVMAATPTPQEVVPTSLAIFKDVEVPPLRVTAPATPVRSTTSPEESSFLASDDRRVNKTPF
eukprot:1474691-Amphidinium_carterae.1